MNKLSVTIITLNEEKNIRACLESVRWADEIVVVDAGSSDATVDICREYTDKVYHRNWTGYADQKRFAMEQATYNWVLSLDADERVSVTLREEITSLLAQKIENDGYLIPRKSYFLSKWIKRCGWYPGYQLRLFRKAKTRVNQSRVHEGFLVDGAVGRLDGDIEHFSYPTISDNLHKINCYTSLEALDRQNRKKVRWLDFLTHSLSEFPRKYIALLGVFDGFHGFLVCWYSAFSKMAMYMKIWHLQRNGTSEAKEEIVKVEKKCSNNLLSVILITKNEEANVAECLESVRWADEVVVVDSQSTDRTREIAANYTDKVFSFEWEGYAANKNIALSKTTKEWVLWIDADERVTPELAAEIQQVLSTKPSLNGFEMPRKAFFLGRWIKHCGWYPGYVSRLFRRDQAKFDDRLVHESVNLTGSKGRLKGALLHYTDNDLDHYLSKFNKYTSLAAQELADKNRRTNPVSMLFRSLHTFCRMYFLRLGFIDGVEGLVLSLLSGGYVFTKYAKLWERKE